MSDEGLVAIFGYVLGQCIGLDFSDEELNAFWPMALGNVRIAISCGLSSCLYQVCSRFKGLLI
jgi:hypothetical protein